MARTERQRGMPRHALAFAVLLAVSLAVTVVVPACADDGDADRAGLAMGMGELDVSAGAPSTGEQAVHSVCGSGTTTFGIDVSSWQSAINWSSVHAAGVKFAFIRVSDGANYSDSRFHANWTGAKAHGVVRGAYQFFRSNQDPIAQANLLLSTMGTLAPGDLPPVVDVESTDGVSSATRAHKLHQWLDRVESVVHVKPIIYTGGYFWDDHVAADFHTYPLWHAGYTGGTCPSSVSSHWPRWTLWQFTSSGHVSGIGGNVDEDRFNGSMAQLQQLAAVAACTPHAEVCNGVDDNCDGVADEGDTCAARDEAIFGAAQFDAPGNNVSDVDGDGVADVCARAGAGVVCALSNGGDPLSTHIATTAFADANGWDDVANFATLRLGDVTGDGKADLCARANAGIVCLPSEGTSFGASFNGPPLSDAHGWNKPEYYSTIRLADVDNDGKADLCARSSTDFRCYLSTGIGFGDPIVGAFFTDADGFLDPSAYGTIRMADIDGDGLTDVCARGPGGVECHRFLGDSFGPAISGPAYSDAHGFHKVEYWSTLRFADLNGDKMDDVCVRAHDAIHCRLSTGTGFSDTDIVGPALADAGGFSDPEEFRTFRVADVNGDALADVCARDAAGFSCFLSTGSAFGERVDGPRWADAHGWKHLKYSGTVMMSGYAKCRPMPEVCDGVDNDCNGVVDDGGACVEQSGTGVAQPPPPSPSPPSTTGPPAGGDPGSPGDPSPSPDESDPGARADTHNAHAGPVAEGGCAQASATTSLSAGFALAAGAVSRVVRRRRRTA